MNNTGLSPAARKAVHENSETSSTIEDNNGSLTYSESVANTQRHGRNDTYNTNFSDILGTLDEDTAAVDGNGLASPPPRGKVAVCVDPISQSTRNFMDMPSTSLIDDYVHNTRFLLENADSMDGSQFTQSQMKKEEDDFYQTVSNEYGDDNIWGLLSGVCGNIYEWYDFAVYGLLAAEIGKAFFPKSSDTMQLIQSFGVYAVAFVMRPIGAICFGEIGDRIAGRKNALLISIVLITVPSILMGILPSYNTIGITAPILLVLFRMFQGLSVGGQLAGSYVLSIEQSTDSNRGFRGSICDASSVGGFFVASLVTNIVRATLSDDTVDRWGWRVPFWVSLGLAPLLYIIVRNSEESKFWDERNKQKNDELIIRNELSGDEEDAHGAPSQSALYDLLSSPFRRRQLLGMIGVLSATSSSFYMLFLYCPIYLSNLRGLMDDKEADFINLCVVFFYVLMIIIAGRFSDAFPHRMDLFRIGLTGLIAACPVMFGMFESGSKVGIFLAQMQFAFCLAMVEGGKAAWEVELWMADPSLSFTGVAVGHNVSATVFGGTMPLISTFLFTRGEYLIERNGDDLVYYLIPGFYVSLLAAISLWCISDVVRHPHDVKTGQTKVRKARSLARKRERARRAKLLKETGNTGGWIEKATSWIIPTGSISPTNQEKKEISKPVRRSTMYSQKDTPYIPPS